jgi:hypothetical protein
MKLAWIVLLFAACVVRLNAPFRLPPPDPDGEPTSAGAAPPEPRSERIVRPEPRGPRRSAGADRYDQYKGDHENSYWNLHREFSKAQEEEAAHHDDEAAGWYHSAVYIADQLLTSLEKHPNPTRIYSTNPDGVMDEPTLIAKTRELRARAQQLGDSAEQRYHAALVAEFHPRTEEQRKVLFEHGRAEVLHRDRSLCWLYLKDGVRETFCWNRAGQLADHTRVDEAAIEFNRIGYRAAMFASGDCYASDCAKRGWDTRLPDGATLETRCYASDCMQRGWDTKLPSGAIIETRCYSSDCAKRGWDTKLPGGRELRCRCESSDCLTRGAHCE